MMYIIPKMLCAQFCRLFLINAFFEFLKFLKILQHWFQFQMQKSRSLVSYRTNEENTCAKVFSKYSQIKIALLNTITVWILLQRLWNEEILICCWIMKNTHIKFSKQKKIPKMLNMFKEITWELFSMLFGFNYFFFLFYFMFFHRCLKYTHTVFADRKSTARLYKYRWGFFISYCILLKSISGMVTETIWSTTTLLPSRR